MLKLEVEMITGPVLTAQEHVEQWFNKMQSHITEVRLTDCENQMKEHLILPFESGLERESDYQRLSCLEEKE